MSFLKKSITPPLFLSQSRRNCVPKLFEENWPSGTKLSNLDSDIIKIQILPLMASAKESSLFRIELIFMCAKISMLRLSLRNVCKLKFTSELTFSTVSDRQSFIVISHTEIRINLSYLFDAINFL